MADDDLELFSNIGLNAGATAGQTSTVGEPSVANNGDQILMTGNWYAARSTDRGSTWAHMNPSTYFPSVDGGFCCDQTVVYDHSRDITIWLLQYIKQSGTNTLRVAVKNGPTLANNAWHWYDFKPDQVNGNWAGEWFDYNHVALSNSFLYVGTNVFSAANDTFTRAVVMRLPLDALANAQGFGFNYFSTTQNGSLRCTQGGTDRMYFASHNNLSEIRLWEWPENSTTLQVWDIGVSLWSGGPYSAPANSGGDFMGRTDGRITGGWVGKGQIGFMWTAAAMGSRTMPHIRVARIDETTKNLIDEPDIWNTRFAFAYPDVCPNDRGDIGVSMLVGGGPFALSPVVGMRNDADTNWRLRAPIFGTDMPAGGNAGDYTTVRRHSPGGLTWLAAGYSLQGGSGRANVQPRVVHFGRKGFTPAAKRWFGV